jgi:hypothetical protein
MFHWNKKHALLLGLPLNVLPPDVGGNAKKIKRIIVAELTSLPFVAAYLGQVPLPRSSSSRKLP